MPNTPLPFFASTPTPTPSSAWRAAHEQERLALLDDTLSKLAPEQASELAFIAAKEDGQVIVRLARTLSARERGSLLLDVEALIKAHIDAGLSLWHEPLGDKSSLRNLRGIEVKG